jgi:hypothetical protein
MGSTPIRAIEEGTRDSGLGDAPFGLSLRVEDKRRDQHNAAIHSMETHTASTSGVVA